jgi:hypothetical protein
VRSVAAVVCHVMSCLQRLGSTYCEEDHGPVMRGLLLADSQLPKTVFEDWYIGWLFDSGSGGDDDGGGGDNGGNDECYASAGASGEEKKDWSSVRWTVAPSSVAGADQWKCGTCLILNAAAAVRCVACETRNPAAPAPVPAAAAATAAGAPSVFSFGFVAPPPAAVEALPGAVDATAAAAAPAFKFGWVGPS